jgi:hypothetical protein
MIRRRDRSIARHIPVILAGTLSIGAAASASAQRRTAVDSGIAVIKPVDFVDAPALVARLHVAPKGEFETSSAFEQRARKAVLPARFYLLRVDASPISTRCSPEVEYDADAAHLHVELPGATAPDGTFGFAVDCGATIGGSYVGSNAMGVKARITRMSEAFVLFTGDASHSSTEYDLVMVADSARRLKPHVRLALLVKPGIGESGQAVSTGRDSSSPTIDNPYDISWTWAEVRYDWLELIAYDDRTGKIIVRADRPAPTVAAQHSAQPETMLPPGLRCFASLASTERMRIRDSVLTFKATGRGDSVGHYLVHDEHVTTLGSCGDSPENPFRSP